MLTSDRFSTSADPKLLELKIGNSAVDVPVNVHGNLFFFYTFFVLDLFPHVPQKDERTNRQTDRQARSVMH